MEISISRTRCRGGWEETNKLTILAAAGRYDRLRINVLLQSLSTYAVARIVSCWRLGGTGENAGKGRPGTPRNVLSESRS